MASEHSWVIKSLNFLINQRTILIIPAVYEDKMLLVRIDAFKEGDNTLCLLFHSFNVPMEISIGDLTSYDKGGLAAVGPSSLQTSPFAA